MLPSKVLYGGDKKPLTDNDQDTQPAAPPPPYSEHSNSNYSGYSGGYHERTPTAPPASLLHDDLTSPSSVIYPMPSPYNANSDYSVHNNYGAVSPPVRYVPDADDHTEYDNSSPQLPLLSSPSPQGTSWQRVQEILSNWKRKSNQIVQDTRKKWRKKWNWYLWAILFAILFIIIMSKDDDNDKSKGRPTYPGEIRSTVTMQSPYPLSPSYTEYNDPEDMLNLPTSQLTRLGIDFTTHSGELHIVATEYPVSWMTFFSQKQRDDTDRPYQLETIFSHSPDNKTLQVTINNDHTSGQLVSVLHVGRQDRQQGKLVVQVGDMTVYMVSQEPDEMIQDIELTLKGSTEGLKLPSSDGKYWKGRNLSLQIIGGTSTLMVPCLEASDTIQIDVTGTAGGDLQLEQSIIAGRLIQLKTKNGSIVMTQPGAVMLADRIDLTTSNSKLLVSGLQPRQSCILRTTNGRIEATVHPTPDDSVLETLQLETDNAAIHLVSLSSQIKNTALISNLGSITMHATHTFDGYFDVQSSLGRSSVEDPEHKIKFDVLGKTVKQGRRGTKDHQITLHSFAGSSRLVFDK